MIKRPNVTRLGGVLIMMMASAAIYGWLSDLPMFMSMLPGVTGRTINIKMNAAIGLFIGGLSLALIVDYPKIARVICAIPFALGFLTLCEYVFQVDLGVDNAIIIDHVTRPDQFPGRMAPITAFHLVNFAVLGIVFTKKGLTRSCKIILFLMFISSYYTLLGYLFDITNSVGGVQWYNQMAVITAMCFMVYSVSMAVACGRPRWKGAAMMLVSPFFGNIGVKMGQMATFSASGGLLLAQLLLAVFLFSLSIWKGL